MDNSQEKNLSKELEYFEKNISKYLKILFFYFLIPLWLVSVIHLGIFGWKLTTWFNEGVPFFQNKEFVFILFAVLLIPILYLIWFYYLTIKKALAEFYKDMLVKWNIEFGDYIAEFATNRYYNKSEGEDLGDIINFINLKISQLPKAFQWLTRKVIDQIPLLEIINTLKIEGNDPESQRRLSERIASTLNDTEVEMIDSLAPPKFLLLIPIDIALIAYLIKL